MSGEILHSLTFERGVVYVEESPDGSLLLTIDGQFPERRVQVWNAKTGAELADLETAGRRGGARFSPDSRRVVTYDGRNRVLRVWDARTGGELLTLEGHRAPFSYAAFSQDGLRLAGVSPDGTTWMWDALTGDLLTILPGGGGRGSGIVFSPDDPRIASFGAGGAKVWSVGVPFRERTLDFAHFANGTGITSSLVFVNVSGPRRVGPFTLAGQPIRPALYFYDKKGRPIAAESVVDITGDLEVTEDGALSVQTEMEPLGELTISTHGRGEVVSGSVKVVSDGPIGGVLRFGLPGIGVAGVGASQPVRDAIFPARRQAGGISTAAAIHNLGEEAMVVSCQLMKDGAVLEEEEIPLEANGQDAQYIEQMFTNADMSDFVGSVRCTAPGEGMFTGVAVELNASNQLFTTLPVVPVTERMDRE